MSIEQSADIHSQRILILDFGSQFTQLIARRVREYGVYSELQCPPEANALARSPESSVMPSLRYTVTQPC